MENSEEKQQSQSEQAATTTVAASTEPVLCNKCKLFFGNAQSNFMCSKCFKESGNVL